MNVFDNKLIHGIHKSRYIVSFFKGGDKAGYNLRNPLAKVNGRIVHKCDIFCDWLRSLVIDGEKLTEAEIDEIWSGTIIFENGKLELQESAKQFIENY